MREIRRRIERLFFHDTVDPRGQLTLVSKKITFPYTVKRQIFQFHRGAEDKLQLSVYVSFDATPDTPPRGENITGVLGTDDYVVGDSWVFDFEDDYEVGQAGTWLKVYAKNEDSHPQPFNVKIVIMRK